jgi:hypothetical protein
VNKSKTIAEEIIEDGNVDTQQLFQKIDSMSEQDAKQELKD